ncbi:MAG: 50S ribosomal protein L20 [Patescibacteria group bacterium]|jgi:large subunit ribosomal protein L20
MARIKRGKVVRRKHKKVLAATKGFRGLRRTNIKRAKEALMKALSYSYRDRRNKKREFRALWINRINAALGGMDIKYSRFIQAMVAKKIILDRKILAQLATQHPEVFERVVKQVTE